MALALPTTFNEAKGVGVSVRVAKRSRTSNSASSSKEGGPETLGRRMEALESGQRRNPPVGRPESQEAALQALVTRVIGRLRLAMALRVSTTGQPSVNKAA